MDIKRMFLLIIVLCTHIAETQGGNIHLVNGRFSFEGTVEVFYNGRWGAVCDDLWSTYAAQVVCSMLGHHRNNAVAVSGNGFNATQFNSFWLDDVACLGSESDIFNCPHRAWGEHNCGIGELAGVRCTPDNRYRDIRLYKSDVNYEGTVEVFYNGRWGAVCDDGWTTSESQVVCTMLEQERFGSKAVTGNEFKTKHDHEFWLDDVRCSGFDTSIFGCSHEPWGKENCVSSELAGVKCIPG